MRHSFSARSNAISLVSSRLDDDKQEEEEAAATDEEDDDAGAFDDGARSLNVVADGARTVASGRTLWPGTDERPFETEAHKSTVLIPDEQDEEDVDGPGEGSDNDDDAADDCCVDKDTSGGLRANLLELLWPLLFWMFPVSLDVCTRTKSKTKNNLAQISIIKTMSGQPGNTQLELRWTNPSCWSGASSSKPPASNPSSSGASIDWETLKMESKKRFKTL